MKYLISAVACFCLVSFPLSAEELSNPSTTYGGSTTSPGSRINRARGHAGDKEHIYSGDVINGVFGRGYDGTAFSTSDRVSIEEQAAEDWSTTANGTKILFKATPLTTASPSTIMTISGTGVAITGNITASSGLFSIYSSSAPRAALAVAAFTIAPGALIYNSTDKEVCVSTGSAQDTFIEISTHTATACLH